MIHSSELSVHLQRDIREVLVLFLRIVERLLELHVDGLDP